MQFLQHKKPADIVITEPTFISMIGLNEHLSSTRNNGLNVMLQRIKKDALSML